MHRYIPITASFISLIIFALFWDQIKLPYDENNSIIGQYSANKYNPANEILRFVCFVIIPIIIYLISYLKYEKFSFSLNKDSQNYFLEDKKLKKEIKKNHLSFYFFFFIILIFIEFLSIDFKKFLYIDTFHDTVYLTPPLNYLINHGFFKSTFYDYGFTGNNLGLIFNFLFGYYSLGSINFIKLILLFFIKLLLIIISKKLIDFLDYDLNLKKIFFIIFTFLLIILPNYYDATSYFSPRTFLYLCFLILTGSALLDKSFSKLKYFFLGTFSLISILWWFDIGFYINFLIALLIIYLLVHSKKNDLIYLISGIIVSWAMFYTIVPSEEIRSFFSNIKFILQTTDYLIGIEYLKPFSQGSTRWTKALLIIYITSIILININFSKKINFDNKGKIFLNLIFISGVVMFKSALTRSDPAHIKYTSGIYTLVLIFLILYFLFDFCKNNKLINKFSKKIHLFKENLNIFLIILVSFLFLSGGLNSKDNSTLKEKTNNFINFKNNINNLIQTNETIYLEKEKLLIVEKYKELSLQDNCLQYFSDDNYFPYFLKKPTCTKYYLSNQIMNGYSENDFLFEFKKNLPNIILYKSPTNLLLNRENLPKTINFIKKNYTFLENFKGYIFYVKK